MAFEAEEPAKIVPPETSDSESQLSRHHFMIGGSVSQGVVTSAGGVFITGDGGVHIDPWISGEMNAISEAPQLPAKRTRPWLGVSYWANRLQDWRRVGSRFECLRGEAGYEIRTVSVLTREIIAGNEPGHIRVTTGLLEGADRRGFCGVLVGVGSGNLDYRAAALVQRGSGIGGGMLCTFATDGKVRFREHTNEDAPLAFAELPAEKYVGPSEPRRPTSSERLRLKLDILPKGNGRFDVQLEVLDASTGTLRAGAIRRNIPETDLLGGIALVSSPPAGAVGARWWFSSIATGGEKIGEYPNRTFGPIAGTLYSLNGSVLKLTAQLVPLASAAPQTVRFQRRPAGSSNKWENVTNTTLGTGYTAVFRVTDWDATRDWSYRIAYQDGTGRNWYYTGKIRRDPVDQSEVMIGLLSCVTPTQRRLEAETYVPKIPAGEFLGRYTEDNIYFPHQRVVQNLRRHDPDLLAVMGDQLYEDKPTRVDSRVDPGLDYLYKWYLWVWSFRSLTRNRPTIVLVDDHDVYQYNLWGERGHQTDSIPAGGYTGTAAFVNRVQRTQTSHNPNSYDPTPVDRGIGVYYTGFHYGGVDFALVEDRKFKVAGPPGDRDYPRELLGPRQERFLADWAQRVANTPAKICLTQTVYSCAQTTPQGLPKKDYDSNGYPKPKRDRAIQRLRDARALVLSGDQHLATLLRHGLSTFTDGPVQFSGPAVASSWQRWFEPAEPLPNGPEDPNTGDFTDSFGNKFQMLAVANPKISFSEYRKYVDKGQVIGDRDLKSDGYGIVRVDHAHSRYVIECWPWDTDPSEGDRGQYSGWPYELPFDQAARQ